MLIPSKTIQAKTGCGNLYITLLYKEKRPFQIITFLGKSGMCPRAQMSISTSLINSIISTNDNELIRYALTDILGHKCTHNHESCTSVLAESLLNEFIIKYIEDDEEDEKRLKDE